MKLILIEIGKTIRNGFLLCIGLFSLYGCLLFIKYVLPVFDELFTLFWDAL